MSRHVWSFQRSDFELLHVHNAAFKFVATLTLLINYKDGPLSVLLHTNGWVFV